MPVNAFQLAQEEFNRSKSGLQQSFESEWTLVNNKYGPSSRNARIETARSKELAGLHQTFQQKASKVGDKYKSTINQFQVIDSLAQTGALNGNPEELKLRLIMPSEANKFLREPEQPKSEIDQFQELSAHEGRLREGLKQFVVRGPDTEIDSPYKFGKTRTAGVGDAVYMKTGRFIEKDGELVEEFIPAPKEDLRRWAILTNELQQTKKLEQNILHSAPIASGIQRAAFGSNRMVGGGTLAKDVIATKTGQTVPHADPQKDSSDPLGIR